MKLEDVRVGMKVIPHAKSEGYNRDFNDWLNCDRFGIQFARDGYLTVLVIWTSHNIVNLEGDWFLAEDFELYEE